jgi:hypothetical protein
MKLMGHKRNTMQLAASCRAHDDELPVSDVVKLLWCRGQTITMADHNANYEL